MMVFFMRFSKLGMCCHWNCSIALFDDLLRSVVFLVILHVQQGFDEVVVRIDRPRML